MNVRYWVELSQAERDELTAMLSKGKRAARKLKRAQILLAADAGCRDDEIARTVAVSGSTVYRTKRRFVEGNLERALSEEPRPGAARKLTGKEEALLVATACASPPEGRARWTLELLAEVMVTLTDHDSLSGETVRRRLAENDLKPCRKDMWCIPKVDGEYVARMEDVLDLYAEAPDPDRPVVCFDERSYAAGKSAPMGASDSLTQEVNMNGQTDFAAKVEPEDFKNTLFLAMELSRSTWLVATFAPRLGDKISLHAVPGGDTKHLLELIGRLQAKLRDRDVSRVRTVCCYEAGYDGVWLHRVLVNHGIENHVLDAASLPIDRRAKLIKTDNIDAKRPPASPGYRQYVFQPFISLTSIPPRRARPSETLSALPAMRRTAERWSPSQGEASAAQPGAIIAALTTRLATKISNQQKDERTA